jgi:hypothetical protein
VRKLPGERQSVSIRVLAGSCDEPRNKYANWKAKDKKLDRHFNDEIWFVVAARARMMRRFGSSTLY